jgi:hypothetical protein
VVLEKDADDQLDRSFEKRSVRKSKRGMSYKQCKGGRIGHIVRRNRLLKYVTEEKIEERIKVTGEDKDLSG